MIRIAALAVIFAAVSAAPARAQAWLPSQGEATVSFVFSDSFVKEHAINKVRSPGSNINTQSLLADVTYGVRDDLSVTVSLPIVRARFLSSGTPPHPTIQDDGRYHTTATDFRVDIRYNAMNKRGMVLTPYLTTVTPSHGYEYFAHAAPGRRVNEVQVGTYFGTTVDKLLPGMFVQGRYGYGIQERFFDFSHNRSLFSVESGYFVTPDVRVFGMMSGQRTHGGLDLDTRSTWPDAWWLNHDRITRENFVNVGGGLGWSFNEQVDFFGSFTTAVSARNTHVLNRAFLFGASIRLQKSAFERGIVTASASRGNQLGRCACQKALALKR
ncbi:MAG: hypothetical protein ACRD2A_18045 [Vicinamibacterales bacterium]